VLRFVAINIGVLLIPVLLGGVFFTTQISEIEVDVLDTNLRNLKLGRDLVENTIRSVDTAIDGVRDDRQLAQLTFLPYPLEGSEIAQIQRTHANSILPRIDDPYILEIILFFSDPRLILTTETVFLNPEFFYPTFYREKGVSTEQWISMMANPEPVRGEYQRTSIEFGSTSREAISLRYTLPLYPRSESRGSLLALLDGERIEELIGSMIVGDQGFALVVSDTGFWIADTGIVPVSLAELAAERSGDMFGSESGVFYEMASGVEWAISYARSDYNNWLYVVGTPVDIFFEQARRVETTFFLIGLAAVLVGIPVAIALAVRSSRPIVEVSQVLKDGVVLSGTPHRDPLRQLSSSVSELLRRNSNLSRVLEEQRPMVSRVVIERLFRGDFSSEEEALSYLRQFAAPHVGSSYVVACALIDSYFGIVNEEIVKEYYIKNSLVQNQLTEALPKNTMVHELGLNRIGIVMPLGPDREDRLDFQQYLIDAETTVNQPGNVRCVFSHGVVVDRLSEIPEGFSIAVAEIYATPLENGIMGHDSSTPVSEHSYFYPAETEARLINLIATGRESEAGGILDLIRRENLKTRSLTVQMLEAFAHELTGTRIKVLRRLGNLIETKEDDYEKQSGLSLEQHIDRLIDSLRELARSAQTIENQQIRHHRLLEYVDNNFRDTDMSLKLLSTQFKLSEVYVSHIFRQISGASFATYVEELRMHEAMRLLASTNETIEWVASRVGYRSTRAFRGAFKRKYGVSPSAVRNG
jgi:AraC-like DNA-binding protein